MNMSMRERVEHIIRESVPVGGTFTSRDIRDLFGRGKMQPSVTEVAGMLRGVTFIESSHGVRWNDTVIWRRLQ